MVHRCYSAPKSFVNFLLPPRTRGEGWGAVKNLRLLQGLLYLSAGTVESPDREATIPCQSLTTGVDNSSISCCWRSMTSLRALRKISVTQRPSWSNKLVESQSCSTSASRFGVSL